MKFLILTEPDDTHAILVKLSLENMGHEVKCLFTADHPTKQRNSVQIDKQGFQWKSSDQYDTFSDNDYDVVWWRRVRKPYVPKRLAHPEDYNFVMRENVLFYESLTYNLSPNAWWVNSKEAATRANSKLLQLKIAQECGLSIPVTLCSNDPKDIRYFLLDHETEGVIYKPLCANFWFEEKRIKASYTAKISFLDLPSNRILQLSPGIFQIEIKKKYELRITCFGDYLVAAKLNSQQHEKGQIDWRAIPNKKLEAEPYILPSGLEHKIRKFMRKIGIVFGAFDFIVTPDDNYVFLEVNEQGQFLWLEDLNHQFNMLDIFVQFLINKKREFHWDSNQRKHFITNYSEQVEEVLFRNNQRHINLNQVKLVKP